MLYWNEEQVAKMVKRARTVAVEDTCKWIRSKGQVMLFTDAAESDYRKYMEDKSNRPTNEEE